MVTNFQISLPLKLKKNDVIVVDGAKYKVTSVSKNNAAVSYKAPKNKNVKTVTIPNTDQAIISNMLRIMTPDIMRGIPAIGRTLIAI